MKNIVSNFGSHRIVSYSNIVAKAHSHIDNLAPSGDYDLNTPLWTAPIQGGDQKNYLDRYFGTVGRDYNRMPKHFVYYKNKAVEYNGTNGKQKYYSSYAAFKNAWLKIK